MGNEMSSAAVCGPLYIALKSETRNLGDGGGELRFKVAKTNNLLCPLSKLSCIWKCSCPFPSQGRQQISLSLVYMNLFQPFFEAFFTKIRFKDDSAIQNLDDQNLIFGYRKA